MEYLVFFFGFLAFVFAVGAIFLGAGWRDAVNEKNAVVANREYALNKSNDNLRKLTTAVLTHRDNKGEENHCKHDLDLYAVLDH